MGKVSKTKIKERAKKKKEKLGKLIRRLVKEKKPLWLKVANYLARPRKKKIEVNLAKIDKLAKPNETILVPGKVLGSGNIKKDVKVAAFEFSEEARRKLGSNALSIEKLLESKEKNIRLII